MTILVIAEHDNKSLNPTTNVVITAATKIGGDIHLLVAGEGLDDVVTQAAKITNVTKILKADGSQYKDHLAENMASLLVSLVSRERYTQILAPATTTGKDFLPRAAALLDVQQLSDVLSVESADTFIHPIYAGNALETVQMRDEIKLLTIRGTAFDKAENGGSATVEDVELTADTGLSTFISRQVTESDRPDLTSANIVVSGGRGIGSADNFALIDALADKLGAAVGASRAAVDAGYVPNDYQVGQTGKVVAPDLYIAVGISGAIQHLAGMKDSKIIVAINKDENAPIFDIADYGLVADLFDAVPELTSAL